MELNYFKDHLFDLLNESDLLDVQDIKSDDKANTFHVVVNDGTKFKLHCELSKIQPHPLALPLGELSAQADREGKTKM